MTRLLILGLLLAVAGCGASGPAVEPVQSPPPREVPAAAVARVHLVATDKATTFLVRWTDHVGRQKQATAKPGSTLDVVAADLQSQGLDTRAAEVHIAAATETPDGTRYHPFTRIVGRHVNNNEATVIHETFFGAADRAWLLTSLPGNETCAAWRLIAPGLDSALLIAPRPRPEPQVQALLAFDGRTGGTSFEFTLLWSEGAEGTREQLAESLAGNPPIQVRQIGRHEMTATRVVWSDSRGAVLAEAATSKSRDDILFTLPGNTERPATFRDRIIGANGQAQFRLELFGMLNVWGEQIPFRVEVPAFAKNRLRVEVIR